MGNGPACPTCGTALRWIPESGGWGCDRCRVLYPVQPQAPRGPAAPARTGTRDPNRKLYIGVGIGAVVLVGVALFVLLRGKDPDPGWTSSEALIKQAIADIAAGDIDALVQLADPAGVAARGLDCSHARKNEADLAGQARQMRRDHRDEVDKAKGLAIEVVDIEEKDLDAPPQVGFDKGDELPGGCVLTMSFRMHRYDVALKVKDKDGKDRSQSTKVTLVELRGRYFLLDPPTVRPPGAVDAFLDEMADYKDQMCACKDTACGDRVQADWTRWTESMSKSIGTDYKPDDDQIRQMSDLMQKYMECKYKL